MLYSYPASSGGLACYFGRILFSSIGLFHLIPRLDLYVSTTLAFSGLAAIVDTHHQLPGHFTTELAARAETLGRVSSDGL